MPNPFMRAAMNRSRDADKPVALAPVPEEYAGDSVPYRGVVDHGVAVADDWRTPREDMSLTPDGRLVDVYEHEESEPDPIPVHIVNRSSRERREFRPVVDYVGDTPRRILGADDARTRATIYNRSSAGMWIGDSPSNCSPMFGFYIPAGGSYQTETQNDVYGMADGTAYVWDTMPTYAVADPAAGAQPVTFTVPDGERWQILAARFTLFTSAVAGNRIPEVNYYNETGVGFMSISAPVALAASGNRTYDFWIGGSGSQGSGNLGQGLPENVILGANSQVTMSVFAMDAGDDINSVRLVYLRAARSNVSNPISIAVEYRVSLDG